MNNGFSNIIDEITLLLIIIGFTLFIVGVFNILIPFNKIFGRSIFDSMGTKYIECCHLCKTEFETEDKFCVSCGNIRRNIND